MYPLKQTRKILGLILIVLAATFSIASPARADEEARGYITVEESNKTHYVVTNKHTSKRIIGRVEAQSGTGDQYSLIDTDVVRFDLQPGASKRFRVKENALVTVRSAEFK